MDKFILTTPRALTEARGNIVRLDEDAINILKIAQRESGLSFKRIASEMIRFAGARLEVMEE